MASALTLALDAMGGDYAPGMVVEGVAVAAPRLNGARFLLFGDKARIEPLLAAQPALAGRCEIIHTEVVVAGDEKPSQALRKGRGSSMALAIEAVKEGRAAGAVSAGNTGALMAFGMMALRTLPGIRRPAICTILPTIAGDGVTMLDLGANVECDAETLVQFAVMGEAFARTLLGIARPTVGLLNVGSEEVKGHDTVRLAAQLLRETTLPIQFKGFVEGDGISSGDFDVVVTDGFTGNIALKTAEGTAKLIGAKMKQAFSRDLWSKLTYLVAKPALDRARERFDPRRFNGAMLVGLNGIVIKSHGGMDALGFANAVEVAHRLAAADIDQRITQDLKEVAAASTGAARDNGA